MVYAHITANHAGKTDAEGKLSPRQYQTQAEVPCCVGSYPLSFSPD